MSDTIQSKLADLGLLQLTTDGKSWELTQQARELFSGTLTSPHKTELGSALLALGMIEPGPASTGSLRWVFTQQGRDLITHLLNNPVPVEKPESDED